MSDASSSKNDLADLRDMAAGIPRMGLTIREVATNALALIERLQQRVAELQGDFDRVNAERWRLFKANAELALSLSQPPTAVVYTQCAQHMGLPWRMRIPFQPPPRLVCPICEPPDGDAVTKTDVCDDCGARGGQHYSLCSKRALADMAPLCNHGRSTGHCDACEEDIERSHTDSLIGKLESVVAGENEPRPEIKKAVDALIDFATRCDHDVLLTEPCDQCSAFETGEGQ